MEGWLLGKEFDKFFKKIPLQTKMLFQMKFVSQKLSSDHCDFIVDGIPDMSDIFGDMVPVESIVYHSSSHLQR